MQSIKVSILGKSYPLRVEEDQAEAMQEIAEYVDQLFREYRNHLKNQPETTAMVLSCLRIAEELHQTRLVLKKAIEENEKLTESSSQLDKTHHDDSNVEIENEFFAHINKRMETIIEQAQKTGL